jgi:IMP dehydrogenase
VNASGKLVGIVTKDNFDLCIDKSLRIKDIMTPLKKLKTAPRGTTVAQAFALMRRYSKKAIPLIDSRGKLVGLYIYSDVKRILSNQRTHNLDARGHLRVGAAVGAGPDFKRRAALCAAVGCDVFQVDTAHGHSDNVARAVRYLKKHYPHIDVLAGNVSDGEGTRFLIKAGADGVLVGQGPGSICTTRMIAGIGVPQGTAVHDAVVAARGTGVPIMRRRRHNRLRRCRHRACNWRRSGHGRESSCRH